MKKSGTIKAIAELIRQTQAAIEHKYKSVDAASTAKLIFEQRHNLKLLLRATKGK